MSQGYFPSQNTPGSLLLQELFSHWPCSKLAPPSLPSRWPHYTGPKEPVPGSTFPWVSHCPQSPVWIFGHFFCLQHSSRSFKLENAYAGVTLSLEMCTTRCSSRFPHLLLKGSTPPALGENSTTVPPSDGRGELPSRQLRFAYTASGRGRHGSGGSAPLSPPRLPSRRFLPLGHTSFLSFLRAFSHAHQGSFTSSFRYICGQTNGLIETNKKEPHYRAIREREEQPWVLSRNYIK